MWIYTFNSHLLQVYRAGWFDFFFFIPARIWQCCLRSLVYENAVHVCSAALWEDVVWGWCLHHRPSPFSFSLLPFFFPQEKSRVTQTNLPLLRANTTFHPMLCTHKKDSITPLSFNNMLRLLSALTLTVENYSSWIKSTYFTPVSNLSEDCHSRRCFSTLSPQIFDSHWSVRQQMQRLLS